MPPPDLSAASDRDIVRSARKGDQRAFRELFRRYSRKVRKFLYGIVGHRERAQDLTQETFAKAFDSLDRYQSERDLAPWLLAIADHKATDYVRVKRPGRADSPWAVTPSEIDTAGLWVGDSSEAEAPPPKADPALEDALNRLPPMQRKCVELRYLQGLSNRAVAKKLRLRVDAVKANLRRAKSNLGRLLGPQQSS